MKLTDFLEKYNGKFVDPDNSFGPPCVDLYRQYCKEFLQVPQSPPVVGAYQIWDTYLKEFFDRVGNTPNGVPKEGDVVIWGEGLGKYGHVAIFIEGTEKSFRSFDQNYPVGSPCHVQGHYYTNVLGWLHPKGGQLADYYKGIDLSNTESVKACVDAWKDVVDGKYVKKEDYVALETKVKENDEAWKERVENEKAQYTDFVRALAEKLATTQTEPTILEQITRLLQVEDKVSAELEPKIASLEERVASIARTLGVEEKKIEETIKKLLKEGALVVESNPHSRLCRLLGRLGL